MTGPLTEQELAERISAIRGSWRNGEWGKAKGWADALVADVIADRDALSASLLAAQEALRQSEKEAGLLRGKFRAKMREWRSGENAHGYDETDVDEFLIAAHRESREGALLGVSAEPLKDTACSCSPHPGPELPAGFHDPTCPLAEPLKDTERATASQSPVAEEGPTVPVDARGRVATHYGPSPMTWHPDRCAFCGTTYDSDIGCAQCNQGSGAMSEDKSAWRAAHRTVAAEPPAEAEPGEAT